MDRDSCIPDVELKRLFHNFLELHKELDDSFRSQFNRSLPLNETLIDRWERAKKYGFGKGTSIYDSSFIFGETEIGENCWIGPFTIIDGTGGLRIGNYCTISVGVHIYTHDNIRQTLTSGKIPIERQGVTIGNNVYLAPNVIITKGVQIGNNCVIGACSFVNTNIPNNSIAIGQPARVRGKVVFENTNVKFEFFKEDNK